MNCVWIIRNSRNLSFVQWSLTPVIESREETPPGQGQMDNFLLDNIHASTMYGKRRKPRSEAQRRHDSHLHQSRHDPDAYTVASLEDMSKTVQEYRERAHKAEVDAEKSEKALIAAELQVGASVSQHEQIAASTQTYQSTQLTEKLCATTSTVNELQQALANTQKDLQKSAARASQLGNNVSTLRQGVQRLRMRYGRAKEMCSHAVEDAVSRARNHYLNAETKRIKRPDGRIEDWVRDLVVELVALDGVPTAHVPQVIERVRRCFTREESGDGDNDQDKDNNQTISDRSVRRMMCESYVKAFMYAAKLFGAAPC